MTAGTLAPEIQQTPVAIHAEPPPTPTHTRKPPLPALTGIRTLLAIGIILFHFTPPHLSLLYPIIDNSFIFVGFFFLLSGFILTYNYSDRAMTLSKREFWLARFSRLYPIYMLVLLISTRMLQDEWASRSHTDFWQGIVLTPLLLQGWSPTLATFGNTVAWTLSSEVMFYFAFPFLLYYWATRMHWLNTPIRLISLFFAFWAFGLAPSPPLHDLQPRPPRRARRPLHLHLPPPLPQIHPAALRLHFSRRSHASQAPPIATLHATPALLRRRACSDSVRHLLLLGRR